MKLTKCSSCGVTYYEPGPCSCALEDYPVKCFDRVPFSFGGSISLKDSGFGILLENKKLQNEVAILLKECIEIEVNRGNKNKGSSSGILKRLEKINNLLFNYKELSNNVTT